jgi:hypothetical protein
MGQIAAAEREATVESAESGLCSADYGVAVAAVAMAAGYGLRAVATGR